MPWLDALRPARMTRLAIVVPTARLRATLVEIADLGTVQLELDRTPDDDRSGTPVPPATDSALPVESDDAAAPERTAPDQEGEPAAPEPGHRPQVDAAPAILARAPATGQLAAMRRPELVAGEQEIQHVAGQAVHRRGAAILVGWTPESELETLDRRLAETGASVVRLPHPAWTEAPTMVSGSEPGRSFRPLVETYGTIPYSNVDPSLFAGVTYAAMFGMMFGDVGHGLILALLGIYLGRTRRASLASFRSGAGLVVGAGLAAALFGVLFGEVFGAKGILAPVWMAPLDHPIELITAGVILGAVFLGASYLIGMTNRWREGGPVRALYASSGVAGACLYLGAGGIAGGSLAGISSLVTVGAVVGSVGLVLLFIGFLVASGGGATGVTESVVELMDAVIRTFANAISFSRLAAFGLTHAAIGGLVWQATSSLWETGGAGYLGAVVVFAVGNTISFGLEALVAAVQALRLEYYELFSRIFAGEGRPFLPWHLAVVREES